jgi:hypothetical protein
LVRISIPPQFPLSTDALFGLQFCPDFFARRNVPHVWGVWIKKCGLGIEKGVPMTMVALDG